MTVPDRIGPYRILSHLGSGGMGDTYVAADADGRQVVVKTIRPELAADPPYVERFRREAQAATLIRSHFVARAVAFDSEGDPPWLALEKVDGEPVRDVVRRSGPLSGERLASFAGDLAEAIHAFRDQGYAHGDLNAGNVLLGPGGLLKVVDLGLARPTSDEAVTAEGPVLGTPYWMAPEVAAGFPPDSSSDVNQWAKLVLFAGSGYPGRSSRDVSDALLQLGPSLGTLVHRGLSTIPANRPDAAELWRSTRAAPRPGGHPVATILTIAAADVPVEPGGEATVTITAHNNGPVTETYEMEVLGPLSRWATLQPQRPQVDPGASCDVQLRLHPPDTLLPGPIPFGVRCAAGPGDGRSVVVEGVARVAAVARVTATMQPARSTGRRVARHIVLLSNEGNHGQSVALDVSDGASRCRFALAPAEVLLVPGGEELVYVMTRSRHARVAGRPVDHLVRVRATTGTGEVFTESVFRQLPLIPPVMAIGILLLVLSAFVIVVFAGNA